MSTPEGKVKEMVRRKMAAAFPRCYRFMPVQSGMGATTLDFLYCVEGLFVAIETKAGTKKPTPRQDYVAQQITAAGGLSFVVRDEQSMDHAIGQVRDVLRTREMAIAALLSANASDCLEG